MYWLEKMEWFLCKIWFVYLRLLIHSDFVIDYLSERFKRLKVIFLREFVLAMKKMAGLPGEIVGVVLNYVEYLKDALEPIV